MRARLAWSLVIAYGVLDVAALAIAARNGTVQNSGETLVAMSAYAVVGGLVASRRPLNPIGWLILAAPLAAGASALEGELSVYGLVTAPGSLPFASFLAWLSLWTWVLMLMPLVFVVFLFPSGRLPSRRWRPVAWGVGLVGVAVTLLFAFGTPDNSQYHQITNPFWVSGLFPLFSFVNDSFGIYVFVFALAVVSLVARYRATSETEKQQLKWVVMGAVFMALTFLGTAVFPSGTADYLWLPAIVALPIAIGIAILRHGLYDIDLIIQRTLLYGLLTAILAGFFVGAQTFSQRMFSSTTGANSDIAVAISLFVIVAVFTPLKERLQALIDRRYHAHPSRSGAAGSTNPTSALATLRELGELHKAGMLTDREFETKKAELLARI